ncbi:efflux transporter outer membrane subunit [Novosphingobium sp. ST904]|uniref:efflux transporter outer membrane subunit n=1 Tax=Novosphingobium sp. ST904 TaxID=1684385 RepID=UPI0006C836B0|nr:efflux transporter outer membrane subunit [Novosphingobium sp. ST904]KPH63628.1 RND transporter [Novosphingobium sp. ST904]TCM36023.1 NodT family efflux transporter outer membrane factor (OMF) lipoprotein [Novosphingobium sp. ST904]
MRPLNSILSAVGGSVLLAGCGVGPRYVAPVSIQPAAFTSGPAVEARSSASESADLVAWWRTFDDPLLTSLVERGLAQNLDLQQAAARVVQARAALKGADAALMPSGQVSGQAGEVYQSRDTPIGRIGSAFPQFERSTETYELNLGVSWEIDLFGGRDAARDAARADWQASQAGAVAARLSVAAQIADTYVAIRMLQARLDVARLQLETQQRLVDLVALQYRKGVAAELQLRQAEGALAQVRASVPALQNELDMAMNALDVLIGVQPGTTRPELAASTPVPAPPAISTAGGPAALLRRRPDIIAAERTLAASNARIGVAVSEYYPKFSLSALLGTATTAAGGLFTGNATQANGVFGLRWRLFDFGRVDAEIKAAKGRNVEALAAYRLTVLRASQDVEDAFSTLLQQEARATALVQGEGSLSRARDASMAAYKGGMASLIEVLDADRRLLETRDGAIQARAAATRGAIASFRALGGGWSAAG